jgi:uncharacterized membrane protein
MNFRFSGRMLTFTALSLLLIWLLLWFALLTNADARQRIVWLLLALSPLMVVGWFLWRGRISAFAWAGFAALGYFAQGVTVVLTSKSDAGYATVEIFLSMALFTSASTVLRAHRRHFR